jgi:hypothetical protein
MFAYDGRYVMRTPKDIEDAATNDMDRCAYLPNDMVDAKVVCMQLASQLIVTHTSYMFAPASQRILHVHGTHGTAHCTFGAQNEISVKLHHPAHSTSVEHPEYTRIGHQGAELRFLDTVCRAVERDGGHTYFEEAVEAVRVCEMVSSADATIM